MTYPYPKRLHTLSNRPAFDQGQFRISAQIASIHSEIRSIDSTFDFSDPLQSITLPFPSPLQIPRQRFLHARFLDGDTSGVTTFQYTGRSRFSEVQAEVKKHF